MQRLILAGCGHSHLMAMRELARQPRRALDIVAINPSPYQYYSGMLPGWMAGHYREEQCRIDLRPLLASIGATWMPGTINSFDAERRRIGLSDGQEIDYDLLSLNAGSETDCSALATAPREMVTVKPLDAFYSAWPRIVESVGREEDFHLAVIGGGAAGVELAFAARQAFRKTAGATHVTIIAGKNGVIADHAQAVRRRITRYARGVDIRIVNAYAMAMDSKVILDDGSLLSANAMIAATGGCAPRWLAASKLALDDAGFVLVDACHRSISHPDVFAAGDICARRDTALSRSGVHAVHAGAALGKNLAALAEGQMLVPYLPRRRSLYLLACGPRYAIASWGGWSAEGAWVWYWKNWLDRKFVRSFPAVH